MIKGPAGTQVTIVFQTVQQPPEGASQQAGAGQARAAKTAWGLSSVGTPAFQVV
jgi:hypothetical protein